jgi:HEAT repeat protein
VGVEILKSEDVDDRVKIVKVLGRIGPESKEAVPGLIEALNRSNKLVCEKTAEALRKVDTPEVKKSAGRIQEETRVIFNN